MPRENQQEVVFEHILAETTLVNQGVTIDALKHSTGLGHSTIRRHLSLMLKEGRIRQQRRETDGTSGRPPTLYFAVKEQA